MFIEIQEHVPLAPLTTFGIGGPARFFICARSVDELKKSLDFARDKKLTTFVLGGGSNVLVDDAGFDGLVIKIELRGVEEKGGLLIAGAGEEWDALVLRAVEKNLWGIENLSGIPGTLGGAVVQNIGAYGQALSQTLAWVEVLDTHDGAVKVLEREAYAPGYRSSIFKKEEGRYVVLRTALRLAAAGQPDLSYADLQKAALQNPSLGEVRKAVLRIRAGKFPDVRAEGAAGSFFKNPILSEGQAKELQSHYPEVPLFAMPEASGVKVPLAWFLDRVLNLRGTRIGSARLFERQPLVIVAEKGTSSAEVKKLATLVQEKIRDTLNIDIEPEVKIL